MPFEFPRCRWHHKKRAAHAIRLGGLYAQDFFETFSEHPGPNFTWQGFPSLVKRLARATAPLEFPGTVEDRYYDLTAETAYDRAVELIRTKV